MKPLNRFLYIAIPTLVILTSCTLNLGGPNKLPDEAAPTTVPLPASTLPSDLPPGLQSPAKPIQLPQGFAINVFAQDLKGPRMLALGPDGVIYVAERGANRIIRLPDGDADGQADQVEIVVENLNRPDSLAFNRDGSLYISEPTRVLHLVATDVQGVFREPQVLIDGLPSGGHNTRTLLFSPDYETLFVSVGSSCNVCDEADPRRAAIVKYNPDGTGEQIYASGIRNAVGIVFRPGTNELWATNNGRDMLGDDLPPETVYKIEPGGDYGWPRCHSGRIIDPEFGDPQACQGVLPPEVEMQAHSAPLGLRFYDGDNFPDEYQSDLFVAFHGSWNRSVPTGYKVVRIPIDTSGKPGPVQDFATGWLDGNSSWGRPVDLLVGPDGALYISDDAGGAIYRLFYNK